MSTRQKLVVWVWIALIAIAGIYPPWAQRGGPVGYHLLFAPPNRSLRIDQSRLTIEWFIATLFAAGLYVAWPIRGRNK